MYQTKLVKLINRLRLEKIQAETKEQKIAIELEIAILTRELINFKNMR